MKYVLVFFILLLAIGGGAAYWLWSELNAKHDHYMVGRTVEIDQGSTSEQIAEKLHASGIIANTLPMRVYVKVTNAAPRMKAGTYTFRSPITPTEVVKQLEQGGMAGSHRLTVIEGWTRWDVANAMQGIPQLKLRSSEEALALLNNPSLIAELDPHAKTLEGYLYPETYFIDSKTTPKSLVAAMVHRFRDVWKKKLSESAKRRGLSVHDTVTVASLVETEAKIPAERPIIASVIFNRLRKRMNLAIDSTIVYASKEAGKWRNNGKVYQSDIDRKSPYNTRLYFGLPPGPIGSPRLESMQAVFDPASTNYLYYVREPDRNDGAHNFYATAEEFEVGVKKLRDWEARQQKQRATKTGS